MMWRSLICAILLAASTSCGVRNNPAGQTRGDAAADNKTTMFSLTSSAFREGQPIPVQFTCDGGDQSPPLAWGEPPPGTKSFALIVDDPDAPSGLFRHWGVYGIPASARTLSEGSDLVGDIYNDTGKAGYSGPCPPKGHGFHHYHFKLFALDVEEPAVPSDGQVADIENAIRGHAIGRGELIGTYERR